MAQENSVSFKVFLQTAEPNGKPEVRRFGIDRDVVSNFSYLSEKLQNVFPDLRSKRFDVSWRDSDGDDVLISTDDELMIALTEMPGEVRKLHVTIRGDHMKDDSSQRPGKRHPGVVCDVCENGINGFRYKCLECINYDLCADCESKGLHPDHFMIRLPVPVSWRPHFGKRLAHHLAKSVRRCHSNASSDDNIGPFGDNDCPCSHHGHGHGHGHGGNRWNGHHRGGRSMGLMDAFNAFVGSWINEPETECPTGKSTNENGDRAKETEGATANGQTQTTSPATSKNQEGATAAAGPSQDEQMQYLKDVGKAVASFLDPLGIDVDVIVERNRAGTNQEQCGETQSTEEKGKKNVTFADEAGNTESGDTEKQSKIEQVTSETSSERESPEKDGWTVVSGADTSNSEPSAPSVKHATPPSPPKPQLEAAAAAAAASNGAATTAGASANTSSSTGAFPKSPGFVFYPPPPSYSNIPSPFPAIQHPWIPQPPAPFPLGMFPPAPNASFQIQPKPPQSTQHQQQQQQQQQQAQRPPLHPDPKINQTVESMMSMGFSNEGGWLTQLVEMKNGDIEKVLDLLQPVKRN